MKPIQIKSLKIIGPAMPGSGGDFLAQPIEYTLAEGGSPAASTPSRSKAEFFEAVTQMQKVIARGSSGLTQMVPPGAVVALTVSVNLASLLAVVDAMAAAAGHSLADTIQAQILTADPFALIAWGAEKLEALPATATHRGGLRLRVSGAKCGPAEVSIILHPDDTYTVSVARRGEAGQSVPLAHREHVSCFDLRDTIDRIIEPS